MNTCTVNAHAKINTFLNIKGTYPNGYHILEMIMYSIELHDTLTLSKTDESDVLLSVNSSPYRPNPANLVSKAINAIRSRFNISTGVKVRLAKNIPSSAGLGGGSADCAAALKASLTLFNLTLPKEELYNIGKNLGADVPFCLFKNPAKVEGIGEILTPIPNFPPCIVLLVKPAVGMPTPLAFKTFDSLTDVTHPNMDKMLQSLQSKNLQNICSSMGNVLEPVAIQKHPVIGRIKNDMLKFGAEGSLMSGSGSSVFGIYTSRQAAQKAYNIIKSKYTLENIFITKILPAE